MEVTPVCGDAGEDLAHALVCREFKIETDPLHGPRDAFNARDLGHQEAHRVEELDVGRCLFIRQQSVKQRKGVSSHNPMDRIDLYKGLWRYAERPICKPTRTRCQSLDGSACTEDQEAILPCRLARVIEEKRVVVVLHQSLGNANGADGAVVRLLDVLALFQLLALLGCPGSPHSLLQRLVAGHGELVRLVGLAKHVRHHAGARCKRLLDGEPRELLRSDLPRNLHRRELGGGREKWN
eukprot:9500924-Pyramimonas_sp.AAC.4